MYPPDRCPHGRAPRASWGYWLATGLLLALPSGCDRPPAWDRLTSPEAAAQVEVYAAADSLQGLPGDTLTLPVRARPVRGSLRVPGQWTVRQPAVADLLPSGRVRLRQIGETWVVAEEGGARDSIHVRSDSLYQLHLESAPTCQAQPRVPARVLGSRGRVRLLEDVRNPPLQWPAGTREALLRVMADTVAPLAEEIFGPMQDLDGDGRWLIVLTERVNRLTPPGSSSFTAGFVAARDAFPSRQTERLFACPGGNSGEVFYGLAPDPNGQLGLAHSLDAIRRLLPGTAIHEMQHLINLQRRLYETDGVPFEAGWLNEAMSHLGEEMLWQRSTSLRGTGPWSLDQIRASGPADTLQHPFWRFARANVARQTSWMMDPRAEGPIQERTTVNQRGSAWAWLSHGLAAGWFRPDWRRMTAAPDSGLANLTRWIVRGDLASHLHNWHVIQALDATGWPPPRPAWVARPWALGDLAPRLFDGRRPADPAWGRGTTEAITVASGSTVWARLTGGADTLRLTPAATVAVPARQCVPVPWASDGVAELRLDVGAAGCWLLTRETLVVLSAAAVPTGQPQGPLLLQWGPRTASAATAPAVRSPPPEPAPHHAIDEEARRHAREAAELSLLVRTPRVAASLVPAPPTTGWRVTLIQRPIP